MPGRSIILLACATVLGACGDSPMQVDRCATNPCENGGVCLAVPDGYVCDCAPGFTGVRCEENVDDCTPNPCEHGGTCTDGIDGYTCACPAGFSGARCAFDIDECEPNPCRNGGSCVDGVNDFSCVCPPGWAGKHRCSDRGLDPGRISVGGVTA
jgi:hypothetical protein